MIFVLIEVSNKECSSEPQAGFYHTYNGMDVCEDPDQNLISSPTRTSAWTFKGSFYAYVISINSSWSTINVKFTQRIATGISVYSPN